MSDSAARIALVDLDRQKQADSPERMDSPERTASQPVFGDEAVGPGKRVTLHFALRLDDGELIDSNFDKSPVVFTVGDGNLLPGFELALFGLEAGAQKDVVLSPDEAFGDVLEDNIQRFPRYRFPPDLALSQGLVIDFADAAGNTQAGVISGFDATMVSVDFNHPLAGRQIRFSVHVLQVEKTENI